MKAQARSKHRKHEGVFSHSERPWLGCLDTAELSIDTGDAKPIRVKASQVVNQTKLNEMHVEIKKMMEMGIIEPIYYTDWASAVVMIMKADGTWRFGVDYRPLNRVTKTESYSPPRMKDLIETMVKAKFRSTIDLNSGFWQIPVALDSIEKTTFICPWGTFAFKRMPFGVRNANITLQRALDKLLEGLPCKRAPTYVDRLDMWTLPGEDHVEIMDQVLERFEKAGASLRASGCAFGRRRMNYLGLKVDETGVYLAEDRVRSIADYEEPKTYKRLHRFLGMASWCRRLIKDFGPISAPLFALLKAKKDFVMNDKERMAFEKLKELMSSMGVMKVFEFEKELVVRTDASGQGIGAVLLQKDDDGILRVIEYASRKSNKVTARYSAEKMEAWAIVWAVRRWHEYLFGTKFVIETDNRALRWMFDQINLSGVIARWVMTMNQYDYEVRHRPGKFNRVADALSRAFPADAQDRECTAEDLARDALEDTYVFPTPTNLNEPMESRRDGEGKIPLPPEWQPPSEGEADAARAQPLGDSTVDQARAKCSWVKGPPDTADRARQLYPDATKGLRIDGSARARCSLVEGTPDPVDHPRQSHTDMTKKVIAALADPERASAELKYIMSACSEMLDAAEAIGLEDPDDLMHALECVAQTMVQPKRKVRRRGRRRVPGADMPNGDSDSDWKTVESSEGGDDLLGGVFATPAQAINQMVDARPTGLGSPRENTQGVSTRYGVRRGVPGMPARTVDEGKAPGKVLPHVVNRIVGQPWQWNGTPEGNAIGTLAPDNQWIMGVEEDEFLPALSEDESEMDGEPASGLDSMPFAETEQGSPEPQVAPQVQPEPAPALRRSNRVRKPRAYDPNEWDTGVDDEDQAEPTPAEASPRNRTVEKPVARPPGRRANGRRARLVPAALHDQQEQQNDQAREILETITRRGPPLAMVKPEEQKADPEFGPIYWYLEDGTLPAVTSEKRRVTRIHSDFVVVDRYLYRFWINFRNRKSIAPAARLLCVPARHRLAIMAAAHDSPYGGGHFGFDKTYAQVKSRFYWGTSAKDVREYCKTCPICQKRNVAPKATGSMENIEPPRRRWELCAMDIVGPIEPPTRNGNQYALVVVDYLTRWPEVIPLPDQTA